jgi:ubiquinone/menaquinone biosynthesis C-methylase UbiE
MNKKCKYVKEILKGINKPLPKLKKTFEEEFKLLLKYAKNKKVLDVGCGSGRPADKLVKYCKEIVGIDIDDQMLSLAKKALSKFKNAKIIKMNALNMSFRVNTFDFVYATYNLIGSRNEIRNKKKLIEEMQRVTKKEGAVVVVYWKNDKPTTGFLKAYYPYIEEKDKRVRKITSRATHTSIGIFERPSPTSIEKLFRECGLKKVKTVGVGPVWRATIGVK